MVSAAVLVIGLGYVVALAARTLPGGEGEDLPLEVGLSAPDWFGPIFNVLILLVAGITAVFLLMNVARAAPRQLPPARRWLGLLAWIVIFALVYRFARPAVEEAVSGTLPPLEDTDTPVDTSAATAASWVVSVLIAAVIAAALTRIGFLVRSSPLEMELAPTTGQEEAAAAAAVAAPVTRSRGMDPVSRVINAYADFEDGTRDLGLGRQTSETVVRYSKRAARQLGLSQDDVSGLAGLYSEARYADHGVDESEAAAAESAWSRIKERLG